MTPRLGAFRTPSLRLLAALLRARRASLPGSGRQHLRREEGEEASSQNPSRSRPGGMTEDLAIAVETESLEVIRPRPK